VPFEKFVEQFPVVGAKSVGKPSSAPSNAAVEHQFGRVPQTHERRWRGTGSERRLPTAAKQS